MQTATVALAGQKLVEVPGTWLRVNFFEVVGNHEATGDIYLTEHDSLTAGVPDHISRVWAKIRKEDQRALSSIFTVPKGYSMLIDDLAVGIAGASSKFGEGDYASVVVKTRTNNKIAQTCARPALLTNGSSLVHIPLCKVKLPEKTDIWINVEDLSKTSSTAFNSYMQATLIHEQTDKLNGIKR